MIYTHVLGRGPAGVLSPLDRLLVPATDAHPAPRGYTDRLVRISLPELLPPDGRIPQRRR
jgi:hypothetical protein